MPALTHQLKNRNFWADQRQVIPPFVAGFFGRLTKHSFTCHPPRGGEKKANHYSFYPFVQLPCPYKQQKKIDLRCEYQTLVPIRSIARLDVL